MKDKFYEFEYIDRKGETQIKSVLSTSLEIATEKLKLENVVNEIKSCKERDSVDEFKRKNKL